MNELRKLLLFFRSINANDILFQVYSDPKFQAFVIQLNTLDQLFLKGEDSLGIKLGDIGGGYSPFTIQLAIEESSNSFTYLGQTISKQVGGSPVLFDTGGYYGTWEVIPSRGGFDIKSNPIIDGDDLRDSYGDNLEGLNKESMNRMRSLVEIKFLEEVNRKIDAILR